MYIYIFGFTVVWGHLLYKCTKGNKQKINILPFRVDILKALKYILISAYSVYLEPDFHQSIAVNSLFNFHKLYKQ